MENITLREQLFEVLKGALRAITIVATSKLQQYVLTGKIRLLQQFRVKNRDLH